MKIKQEQPGESKRTVIAFAIAAAISLAVVHTHTFGAEKNPNGKLIQALDAKNVQYVISNGDLFVIDDSDPAELCELAKKTKSTVKAVFNSKTIKQQRCK